MKPGAVVGLIAACNLAGGIRCGGKVVVDADTGVGGQAQSTASSESGGYRFPCGSTTCHQAFEYCKRFNSDTGEPPTFSCVALPSGCPPTCQCIINIAADSCASGIGGECDDDGPLVTCFGG